MKILTAAIGLMALTLVLGVHAGGRQDSKILERHESGPWTFEVSLILGTGERLARIHHGNDVLWEGEAMYMGWGFEDAEGELRGVGDDITGEGTPDVVLCHNRGDARGRNTVHLVFDLESMERCTIHARVQELGNGRFEDRDGDGAFEFYEREAIRSDRLSQAIGVWSQWPEVCYVFRDNDPIRGGRYAIDVDRMRRPPLHPDTLQKLIQERNTPWDGDSPHNYEIGHAAEQVLGMLAEGNHEQAWQYWNAVRPCIEEIWSFEETTNDLKKLIEEGPYRLLLESTRG